MPRQQRYRLPGVPQHVVARGNNRQATFFDNSDNKRGQTRVKGVKGVVKGVRLGLN